MESMQRVLQCCVAQRNQNTSIIGTPVSIFFSPRAQTWKQMPNLRSSGGLRNGAGPMNHFKMNRTVRSASRIEQLEHSSPKWQGSTTAVTLFLKCPHLTLFKKTILVHYKWIRFSLATIHVTKTLYSPGYLLWSGNTVRQSDWCTKWLPTVSVQFLVQCSFDCTYCSCLCIMFFLFQIILLTCRLVYVCFSRCLRQANSQQSSQIKPLQEPLHLQAQRQHPGGHECSLGGKRLTLVSPSGCAFLAERNNFVYPFLAEKHVHEFTAYSSLVLDEVEKQSTCELEVDAVAVDILNRLDVESKLAHTAAPFHQSVWQRRDSVFWRHLLNHLCLKCVTFDWDEWQDRALPSHCLHSSKNTVELLTWSILSQRQILTGSQVFAEYP